MGRFSLPILLLALVLPAALPCAAAEIHAGLESELRAIGDEDFVSVILILREQADVPGLNAALKAERARLQDRHERVVRALQAASVSQEPLLAALEAERTGAARVEGYTGYWISNLVVAKVTKGYLYELAARPDVAYIEPNFTVELIRPLDFEPADGSRPQEPGEPQRGIGVTPGLRAINADRVWYELGINGTGTIVGTCDTGVDGNHPALASRWRGLFAPASHCWLNLINNGHPNFPYDGYGHGTHVQGTICGLGAATQDTIGVAWGALWIATDPINQGAGGEFDNDIIAAYQWFADPDGNPNTHDDVPDVVQNSWRVNEGFGYNDCDSRWWAVIDNCEAAGCVTTWSAGNEGPSSTTIGSPADRATTLTNCFAVGAVDATNYSYPWPIAGFSSRGPTGCNVPPDRKIKPEVVAPGVDVYSSVPGGGYNGTYDGTSMAGPHVAGVAALMREANPDLDVDTIKEIIMATAVDLGVAGEENTYGWGMIDAYEAVLAAMTGFGRLEGTVTNASNGGTPVAGATIEILEADRATQSNISGFYAVSVAPGIYTVRATHPSFAPATYYNVAIAADETVVRNFALLDIAGPAITATTQFHSTDDTTGPYAIETTITDYSALAYRRLLYRVNGGAFQTLNLVPLPNDRYTASIPGQPHTSHVEYYIAAADVAANASTDPAGAPGNVYGFYVAPVVSFFAADIEDGAPAWSHGVVTPGFVDQWHLSTQRNHTPAGSRSWKCGDTGSGDYANLLDAGLVTPVVELGLDCYLRFWHWIEAETSAAYPGYAYDGGIVEISLDGGPWQQIFPDGGYDYIVRAGSTPGPFPAGTPFFSGTHDWQQVHFNLREFEGPAQFRFRFGSDGADVREGWFIDDLTIRGFQVDLSAVPADRLPGFALLHPADPNPFTGETRLRYELRAAGDVRLALFDPSGRLVRTLVSGHQPAGLHQSLWDGRDEQSRPVAPGVYFYRLQAGDKTVAQKVIVTR
ncbi:MAG: S8 family serine peptidase [Candidatus Eisenbacteria bacterium]|uniref:S8 family serine peptidase n=1 Tax=Eiseniibacteriota bacterium TaxID=2212470 RepID=A0A937XC67_UNCEI|nr:S8 family serine peptidase [Candidatus Eisenbacteria bacterium]